METTDNNSTRTVKYRALTLETKKKAKGNMCRYHYTPSLNWQEPGKDGECVRKYISRLVNYE